MQEYRPVNHNTELWQMHDISASFMEIHLKFCYTSPMNRNITYVIPCEKAGLTIQQFLKEKGYTHGVIVLLKRTQNGIRRNGIWAKTSDILQSDDLLEIMLC